MNESNSNLIAMPVPGLAFGKRAYSLGELLETDLPKPTELVSHFLFEGETVLLVARPKTGKTRLAQQLAFAVATGADFLGQHVARATPVLYLDLESHPANARERLAKIGGPLVEAAKDQLQIYSVPNLGDSEVGLVGWPLANLQDMVRKYKPGLLIIDTWRLICKGKENEAEQVVENLKAVDSLRTANPKLTILLIHHLRKTDQKAKHQCRLREDPQEWLDNISGSHALVAHTDASFGFEVEIRPTGDVYVLTGVRRNGPSPLLVLQSNEENLRFEHLGDKEQMEMLVFTSAQLQLWRSLPDSFSWSQAEEIAQKRKRLLSATLRKAEQNGLLEHPDKQRYRRLLAPLQIAEQAA